MGIIAWIVLGVIAGFIASKIVNKQGSGFVMDLCLGIVGAVVGGYLFDWLGYGGVQAGHFLYSIVVATVGAIIVLFIYHAVAGRRTPV